MNLLTILVSATALLASVSSALAQTAGTGRPSGGLFGMHAEAAGVNQGLNVTALIVQAYDENLLAESGSLSPGTPNLSGHFTMLHTGSEYKWATRSLHLGLTGSSAFRYYGRVGHVQTVSHAGAAGLSAKLGRRTKLLINQGAAYSPSYLFALFPQVEEPSPGDTRPTAPDHTLDDIPSYSYSTTARMMHGLTRRASVSATLDYTYTDFVREEGGHRDMAAYGGRAEFSRSIGRRTGLHTGYRYRTGHFRGVSIGSVTEHGVDVGVGHTRALSGTRQAHFDFRLGISGIEMPPDRAGVARGRLYRLLGDATFGYDFGRSWRARAVYRRGLEYVAELTEPVYVGGATATVDGLITRRLDFHAAAGYSSGETALRTGPAFDTYSGNVRSRFALTPGVAVFLQYFYYVYDFGSGTSLLAPGLSPQLERHGVRAGLTLWLPVFRR